MRILYFSTVNWRWIKQRPHFVASYLAELGHQVDYVSLNPIGKTRIKRHKIGRLAIKDTYVLPYSLKSRLVETLNTLYINSQLFDKIYDIIILTNPLQYHYIPNNIIKDCVLVYECMDNMPYFYDGKLRERIAAEERKLLACINGVITSSDALTAEVRKRAPQRDVKVNTIYNALDLETFSRSKKRVVLKEPNLVYIGTIGDWLDWQTINQFAERHPNYTIYLIGPVESRRAQHSNIQYLGTIPHSEVPNYIVSSGTMLLPFRINALTKAVDPVKLYEYLALNKNVVSSYWQELDKFNTDKILFYQSYEEFESNVLRVANDVSSGFNLIFAEMHDWGKRVEQYNAFIHQLYSEKTIQRTEKSTL